MYKGSAYSGYPFLMLSDPYLPNGSMSPLVSPSSPHGGVSRPLSLLKDVRRRHLHVGCLFFFPPAETPGSVPAEVGRGKDASLQSSWKSFFSHFPVLWARLCSSSSRARIPDVRMALPFSGSPALEASGSWGLCSGMHPVADLLGTWPGFGLG